ncbi:hypothetical protein M422DRAFT_259232 [Sphaerobolus stellatus SS14]|uniref:EH domain-containing protein n=1 Tax=Sphaerobolus stellatus (strain SS14) TaxID=990650 RepID=A0A0C9UT76_SPHS4|nr:hypothetical protein M422DRAFT_259232 [Sphaerobolus stellatus SS14]
MERPKAFTTLADSIRLAILMWSIPGTEPALFLPEAFVCFLEGAISVLPASTQQVMKQYLGSLPKHQSDTLLYHQNDVTRAIVLVWRAQSFGSALKPEMIPDLHLLDNPEGKVEWHHFGIPVANEAFIKVLHTTSMKNGGNEISRAAIHKSVLELSIVDLRFSQAALHFSTVWNLLDPLKTNQTDTDGLYLVLYLVAFASEGRLLPTEIPESYKLFMLSQRNQMLGQPSAFITTPQRPIETPGAKINRVNLTPNKHTPVSTNPFRTSTTTPMSAVNVTLPQHTRRDSVSSAISSSPQHPDSPSPPRDPSGPLGSSAQATSQNFAPPQPGQINPNSTINQTAQPAPSSSIPVASGTTQLPSTNAQSLGNTISQSAMPNTAAPASGASTNTVDVNPQPPPHAAPGNTATNLAGIPLSSLSTEELSKILSQRIIELALPQLFGAAITGRRSDISHPTPVKKQSKSDSMHKLDADIREKTNTLLKWNRAEHPFAAPPLPPSDEDLENFAKGLSAGPTVETFSLDLRKSEKLSADKVSKQRYWNMRGSVVFAREFLNGWDRKEWPYPPQAKNEAFVAQRFRDKLGHLKDVYALQVKLNQATPAERVTIRTQIRLEQKPERHRARREESLELRKKIARFHDFPPGYLRMLDTLGPDGMSSDETDEGSTSKPFKFRRLHKPYRSTHVDKLIFVIDKAYEKPNRLGAYLPRQGNTRRVRLGTHPVLYYTGRIPEYPKEFYNMHYLQKFPGAVEVLQQSPAWQLPHPLPEPWLDGYSQIADQFTPHIWAGYEADTES